ncbi:MAG: serine hydroxymethyltransferase, partial [Pseudomonadota bacterium]
AFAEALQPDFNAYQQRVKDNAKALAASLMDNGLDIVSGGTENHSMLVDLRPKKATGKRAEAALGRANITCNKNGIPFDPEKPFVTSGIRLGSPAGTTRGFGEEEFREIGNYITEVLDGLMVANDDDANEAVEAAVKAKVVEMTNRFPMYSSM